MSKECLTLEPLRKLFESIIDVKNNRFLLSKLPKGLTNNIIQGHVNSCLVKYQDSEYWVTLRRDNTILIQKYTGVFNK